MACLVSQTLITEYRRRMQLTTHPAQMYSFSTDECVDCRVQKGAHSHVLEVRSSHNFMGQQAT